MTEVQKPWASFGYEPVPYLTNRRIARYLRTQRKNMRRFFEERGMFALADRMNQIRKSRQGMLGKNKMFQEVLNLYAQQSMPARSGVSVPGAVLQPAPVIAGETDEASNT